MSRADELARFAELLAEGRSVAAAAHAMDTTYVRAKDMLKAIRRQLGAQAS